MTISISRNWSNGQWFTRQHALLFRIVIFRDQHGQYTLWFQVKKTNTSILYSPVTVHLIRLTVDTSFYFHLYRTISLCVVLKTVFSFILHQLSCIVAFTYEWLTQHIPLKPQENCVSIFFFFFFLTHIVLYMYYYFITFLDLFVFIFHV